MQLGLMNVKGNDDDDDVVLLIVAILIAMMLLLLMMMMTTITMMIMMMVTKVLRGMMIHQDRRERCSTDKEATGFTQITELNPKR